MPLSRHVGTILSAPSARDANGVVGHVVVVHDLIERDEHSTRFGLDHRPNAVSLAYYWIA